MLICTLSQFPDLLKAPQKKRFMLILQAKKRGARQRLGPFLLRKRGILTRIVFMQNHCKEAHDLKNSPTLCPRNPELRYLFVSSRGDFYTSCLQVIVLEDFLVSWGVAFGTRESCCVVQPTRKHGSSAMIRKPKPHTLTGS